MSALYAFSRRVDDIGDSDRDDAIKRARLEDMLARIREGRLDPDDADPVGVALAHATRTFPIPLDALDQLIDGVLMDVRGETYESWNDLMAYCRCVGGTIGRVSLGVLGTMPGARDILRASEYADTLGVALQLTNILRDVREDADNGRTYLPAEVLAAFGCRGDSLTAAQPADGADFAGLVQSEVRRARALFADGLRPVPMLDRRSGACVVAMAGIYRKLLGRIARDPGAVLRGRVSVPRGEKAYVALRGLSGVDSRHAAPHRTVTSERGATDGRSELGGERFTRRRFVRDAGIASLAATELLSATARGATRRTRASRRQTVAVFGAGWRD